MVAPLRCDWVLIWRRQNEKGDKSTHKGHPGKQNGYPQELKCRKRELKNMGSTYESYPGPSSDEQDGKRVGSV